jgi:hypothetical protein
MAQLTELGKTNVEKELFAERTVLFGQYVTAAAAGTDCPSVGILQCSSECPVRRNVNRIQKNCKHSSTFLYLLTEMKFAKNLEFQNQKTGFKNVAVLEKEENKSFKKTQENKLATENGKQKLEAMMTFLFENGVSSCLG